MSVLSLVLREQTIDTPFQVSLGNDHKMRAFYILGLDSSVLQVSDSGGNLSVVVNRLMKSPARNV